MILVPAPWTITAPDELMQKLFEYRINKLGVRWMLIMTAQRWLTMCIMHGLVLVKSRIVFLNSFSFRGQSRAWAGLTFRYAAFLNPPYIGHALYTGR